MTEQHVLDIIAHCRHMQEAEKRPDAWVVLKIPHHGRVVSDRKKLMQVPTAPYGRVVDEARDGRLICHFKADQVVKFLEKILLYERSNGRISHLKAPTP